MINPNTIKVGDKVYYQPIGDSNWKNGIVKEIQKDEIGVVFYCGGNWVSYTNYASEWTHIKDLHLGWGGKKQEPIIPDPAGHTGKITGPRKSSAFCPKCGRILEVMFDGYTRHICEDCE